MQIEICVWTQEEIMQHKHNNVKWLPLPNFLHLNVTHHIFNNSAL